MTTIKTKLPRMQNHDCNLDERKSTLNRNIAVLLESWDGNLQEFTTEQSTCEKPAEFANFEALSLQVSSQCRVTGFFDLLQVSSSSRLHTSLQFRVLWNTV